MKSNWGFILFEWIAWITTAVVVVIGVVVFLRLRLHHIRTHSQFNSSTKWVEKVIHFLSLSCVIVFCAHCAVCRACFALLSHRHTHIRQRHMTMGRWRRWKQHQQQDNVRYFSCTATLPFGRPLVYPPANHHIPSAIVYRVYPSKQQRVIFVWHTKWHAIAFVAFGRVRAMTSFLSIVCLLHIQRVCHCVTLTIANAK